MYSRKSLYVSLEAVVLAIILFIPIVRSVDTLAIPASKDEIEKWFDSNVGPLTARRETLDPDLVEAEESTKVVTVKADGTGTYKTLTDAINSIPEGSEERIIIKIGPGNYTEKVKIQRYQPFITLYGDPNDMPVLIFDGTAAQYGTVDSATVIVESEYFNAVNIKFVNSAPRPDGKRVGAQAAALRIGGDMASFYNCSFYGFQDTLCDDKGQHFFKDCYIEGTVDFIFGSGTSIYLNSEIHVISGDSMAMVTAHARSRPAEANGFVFVHCNVTGTGGIAVLGRPWYPYARVVFAYSELSDVINPEGWSDGGKPANNSTAYFGEYNNKGPGADLNKRVAFMKKLTSEEAKPFLSLAFIDASTWLLPPSS